jgi:hypothetical protein
MEFIPSRLLLGLRVADSVPGITLDTESWSESESEEEMYSMYSMLSISVGIVPRIWKGAGRCQDLCTSKVTWTRVYSLDRSLPLLGSD